jgi:hypothetical protein
MTTAKAKADATEQPAQKPSIARIVHVPMDPKSNNGETTAAAVITHVWNENVVDVRILQNNAGIPIWRGKCQLAGAVPEYVEGEGIPNVWAWPPRN